MFNEILRTGLAALSVNIRFVILCVFILALNQLSIAQVDLNGTDNSIAAKVEKLMEEAQKHISIGNYELAREKYSAIVNDYSNTEYAMEALGEIASLYVMRWNDQAVDGVIDKLVNIYSAQPKVTRVVDRIAQSYIRNNNILKAQNIYNNAFKQFHDHSDIPWLHGTFIRCQINNQDLINAQQSIEEFKKKYSTYVNLSEVINSLADTYKIRKEYNLAKNLYQYVYQTSSDQGLTIEALTGVGLCEIRLKNLVEVDIIIEELKKKYSKHEDLCRNLCLLTYEFQYVNDYINCKPLCEYILQKYPDHEQAVIIQRGLAQCEIRLGDLIAADNEVKKLKLDYSDNKGLWEQLSYAASEYTTKGHYDKGIDIWRYIVEKSQDDIEIINALTKIGGCQIRLKDSKNATFIIEQLKQDFPNNKELFLSLLTLSKDYWRVGNLDKASQLCQYALQKFPNHYLAIRALAFIARREIRAKKVEDAGTIIKKIMRDYSEHVEYFDTMNHIAMEHRWNGYGDKSKEYYHYIVNNCPDRELALRSLKNMLILDMAMKSQSGFVQDIEILIDKFADHPEFNEFMDKKAHEFLNRIKFITLQKLDKPSTRKFYRLIIDKYPESSFVIPAKCQLVKLDCEYNRRFVDEKFKKFLSDQSVKSEYLKYLDHILSRDGSFRQNYRNYVFDCLGKKIESSKALVGKVNSLELLIKYSDFKRFSKQLHSFTISCANKGRSDLFVKIIDRLRETKEKQRALEVCKLFLDSNPKRLCGQVVLLKTYNIKYEEGQADSELAKHLDEYIKNNFDSNKKLACQGMLLKGRVLIKMGEIEQVRKIYETYIKEEPNAEDMPEVLYYIGYACMIQGDFEGAKSAFNTILTDHSKSEYADKARRYIQRINTLAE